MTTVVWKMFVMDGMFVSLKIHVKTTKLRVLGDDIFGGKLGFGEVIRVKPSEWD